MLKVNETFSYVQTEQDSGLIFLQVLYRGLECVASNYFGFIMEPFPHRLCAGTGTIQKRGGNYHTVNANYVAKNCQTPKSLIPGTLQFRVFGASPLFLVCLGTVPGHV